MLDFKVFHIREVVDMEELLYLCNTLCCKMYSIFLFAYYEITCLLGLLSAELGSHNGFHLGELFFGTLLHLTSEDITHLVKLGGLAGRT